MPFRPAPDADPDFALWLRHGIERGWISDPFCYVHDAPPLTQDEDREVNEADGDLDVVCFSVVRLG